jgi:inner membrane protein
MFLVHGPISYLANEAIQKEKISGLKQSQQIFIATLSLIFGILPDFDFLILMMFDRPSYTHHDFFTHTPIYWIAVWLLLFLFSKVIYPKINRKSKHFLTKDLLDVLLNAFLIAGLSHLLADMVVGNVMLFYPLSNMPFTLLRYIFEPSYFTGYFGSVYFAIEIIILAVFFWVFSKKFLRKHKWDDIVAYVLLTVSSIYLLFTLFLNFQTYNKSFLEESNKPHIDYDMDYDTLRDVEDMDVDNDGVDNIVGADYTLVVENTKRIIDSNKLAVGERESFSDSIYLKYGALSSYRLVSQAFYESNSPIEPVLKDYYIKSLKQKEYTVKYDHVEVLKDFLDSKDMLLELNLEGNPLLASGKIFFVMDDSNEILNMGITLNGNNVGIVLPGERHVQHHTFDGIMKFYENAISTLQMVR